ncbi:MAG: glycosyltransferase family 2 protein [Selenomonas ruminantium]|nr:glycosyltransferase family 2 protein [Selenomonas ruminantium]
MPKVTIIIPVYNVEKYLSQCIESAIRQTMRDIEILCIDDGSTDSSPSLLDEYSNIDSRIRVIHKENAGYGHTMNLGIDKAQGEYIFFLESDDFLLPNICQDMYEACQKNKLDIAKAGYYRFFSRGDEIYKKYVPASWNENYECVLDKSRYEEMFQSERYTWMCMYAKVFLDEFNIRHNETPGASFQDNGFWFISTMYCRRMCFLNRGGYMYRLDNPTSSIHDGTKIYSLAEEYAFIRERVKTYPENKKWYFTQAALYDFGLHFWYFTCVHISLMRVLAYILSQEIRECFKSELFRIEPMDNLYSKKLLTCMASPELFASKMQEENDDRDKRYGMVSKEPYIILYGAGRYAEIVLEALEEFDLWDKKILCGVTQVGNKEYIGDKIKICKIDELLAYRLSSTVILCAKKDSQNFIEMKENLCRYGFENIVYANDFLVKKDVWNALP